MIVFYCLCFWHLDVFAETVIQKSVTEGDSVALDSGLTGLQKHDLITWTFGDPNNRIAAIEIEGTESFQTFNGTERFRDRLKLDHQTGSLTITDTTITDSGLYTVTIKHSKNQTTYRFNVTVYARLPVPVISRNCSSSSSLQNCSLLCSVVNVSHVTLSWFKGNSVLSSISVSDLSISLSLSLEVEYQENNTYSCVLNNSFTNHTTHLDISQLCKPCAVVTKPGQPQSTSNSTSNSTSHSLVFENMIPFLSAAAGFLLIVAAVGIFWIYRRRRKTEPERTGQTHNDEITYADPTFLKQKAQKPGVKQEEDVVYAGIVTRR